MEIFSIVWQFLLLWAFIYTVVFLIQCIITRKKDPNMFNKRQRSSNNNTLLPFTIVDESTAPVIEQDQWSIKLFQVKYTTQRLNRFFASLTQFAPNFWRVWFSLGVLTAAVLMVVGMGVIVYAGFKILSSFGGHVFSSSNSSEGGGRLSKRGFEEGQETEDQVFLPMIPGVTLPMSHIGYYLLALTICGLFHEGGHAVASYSQGVPIQSSGMFVLYLYPGAFVNIPDQPLASLNPFQQLKIMCAGVWHNLVLYLYTYISLAGGLKLFLLLLGWKSLEGLGGVSVVHIRPNSPLAPHLPPSTIIYQLDDFPLVNNIEDWNVHLFQESGRHTVKQGFCVARPVEDYYGKECCDINDEYPFGRSSNASISCFNTFPSNQNNNKVCLPTLEVLASVNPNRCYKSSDCIGDTTTMDCVTPYTPSVAGQVVRIYARFPSWINQGEEKVFVFEGELVDIWESVKVSLLSPKFRILPASLPHILELLLRYISSFTLALAMLNILPAFKLDGEFALEQFFILLLQPQEEGSIMTTRSVESHRLTRKMHEFIVKITSFIVGFVIIGSILVGLLFKA